MSDEARLVVQSLSGSTDAFSVLVKRYQMPIYALALQRTGCRTVAKDIVQEVFLVAYQKLDQLKDRGRFGAWLRQITLRQCQMWLRAETRRRNSQRHAAEMVDASSAGGQQNEDKESFFGIESLIRHLPECLKAVAVLCLVEDLSPSAAASVLGLKPGTLRKRLHDARARLQRRIVEQAEKHLQLHLLPKDFAQRCVCRCKRSARSSKSERG